MSADRVSDLGLNGSTILQGEARRRALDGEATPAVQVCGLASLDSELAFHSVVGRPDRKELLFVLTDSHHAGLCRAAVNATWPV